MRNYALVLWCVLISVACYSQSYWEGGFHLGTTSYQGDMNPNSYPTLEALGLAYGLFLRKQMDPVWSVRLDLKRGLWRGSDAFHEDADIFSRNYSFSNTITQGSLLMEWDPWGRSRFREVVHRFRPRITPFLFVGAGTIYSSPETNYELGGEGLLPEAIAKDKASSAEGFRFALPVGGGIKVDLGFRTTLAFEMSTTYAWSDLIDGVSASGNPDARDWLVGGGTNLTFRFAAKDRDGDQVVDKVDDCPSIPGNISANGCPDRDGDGVEDVEDVCPDLAGLIAFSGCPDTDEDGLMDPADSCPLEYGYEETNGCPDRDNDCVADAEDICPDEPGRVDLFGCPDTDQDGLADHLDPCPEEAGLLQYSGCPLPDTDCDGVLDTFDLCPTVTDTTNFSGCPDTDQDGLIDLVDRCPEQSGPLENKGCPQLAETEQKVLVDAQRDVRFKTGRADLLASSKDILNKIVEILEKYPAYHLRLDGYTDSVGREVTNQKLSENRAKSCFMYLIGQGIEEDRLSFSGYGEENPIGDNKTKAGRQLNRRVEFELFLPTIKSETDLDAKKDK